MLEQIRDRYGKGYITKEQLERYVKHGVITSGQAEEIKGQAAATPTAAIPTADLDSAYREGVNNCE